MNDVLLRMDAKVARIESRCRTALGAAAAFLSSLIDQVGHGLRTPDEEMVKLAHRFLGHQPR